MLYITIILSSNGLGILFYMSWLSHAKQDRILELMHVIAKYAIGEAMHIFNHQYILGIPCEGTTSPKGSNPHIIQTKHFLFYFYF